ncbi:hypothetical protein BFJ72_g6800 [Fusarium proliferatum]|uniref:Tyrosine--tRNA ligase n=1 Tax=Gibberella intermedia TaxID=948311 RepID=A0A420TCR3_GIBIN|nr:hypothetical protein BFJ72_g6800 [Fusarium proliferatum]
MTPEESITLIKANLAEVLNPEIIDDVILKGDQPLRVYWGTAPTGKPHCGYFVPMVKIAELLHAGCHVKILLADKHAHMDSQATLKEIKYRCEYYRLLIQSSLKAIGVDVSQLEFVVGSSFQETREYEAHRFRFSNNVTVSPSIKAGSEVVKQGKNPTLGSVEYPIRQSLDEEYLNADAELGGVDQRKLFTFAIDHMPKLDCKKAVCAPKEVEGNGVVAFIEHVIFRVESLKTNGEPRFTVETRTGEILVYEDISKLKEDYASDILTPQMIKPTLIKALNDLLDPIRKDFESDEEWKRISKLVYPVQGKPERGNKVKNNGKRSKGLPIQVKGHQATDSVILMVMY